MIEIEYEFRQEDLVHFNELCIAKNPLLQKELHRNRLFTPAAMFLIGFFYYVYYHDITTTAYIVGLAFLWAMISPYTTKMDFRRQILAKYTDAEKKDLFGIHKVIIDPNYLIDKMPGGRHKTAWSEVMRIEQNKEYIYIYTDLKSAIIIPLETVIQGNIEQFTTEAEKIIARYET
ncbi:MAG: hypothetical protein RL637_273 [Pseudomonadota bacterium]|jgi:hypothetical protein